MTNGVVGGMLSALSASRSHIQPLLVGGCLGQTEGKGAFPELAQMTREFKQLPGVIATALTMTHPYLDFARMGGSAMVVAPEAATNRHRAGIGRKVTLTIGHRLDPRWGQPVPWTGNIVGLSDGSFEYSDGI